MSFPPRLRVRCGCAAGAFRSRRKSRKMLAAASEAGSDLSAAEKKDANALSLDFYSTWAYTRAVGSGDVNPLRPQTEAVPQSAAKGALVLTAVAESDFLATGFAERVKKLAVTSFQSGISVEARAAKAMRAARMRAQQVGAASAALL